ncbi:MAG: hypothetical protein HY225_01320 [Candidatus Vogelbacteria bacterium]|nr:hypothetical protein [Candidatus Vogelbacteria bacterium]
MESKPMNKGENKRMDLIHELARKYEPMIKGTVMKKFEVDPAELSLLLDDQAGVYLSKEERDTLCSFVLGKKNGHMYLVAAKIEDDGRSLCSFKCDIVS